MTHRELCKTAAIYLRKKGIQPYHPCQYVVCDFERIGECPDAFGWSGNTQLIEVKVSRADFLSDKKKTWRQNQSYGLGSFRSYLCPEGVINESDLPKKWGLLYLVDGVIKVVKPPDLQESNHLAEIALISSVMRREGIKARVFSYKNYKIEKLKMKS